MRGSSRRRTLSPNGAPIVIAAYLTGARVDRDQQSAALADVGQAVAATIG